ncbi:TIM barrel protein [Allokutzneria sp. A3M-2-11 16]|uniref:sugar phosphate isomerase/epimerase family protein n=1 Tax=Allokutzneria sp. A3M-2-11 16 TaxID=2962043 RepID=UPI0020B6F139|nr:TIM barrel protein [Allokutzneria sp. A3M-2-11 16]MCP3802845.1 TIM barrel protein [Allokutzneria sp. A3M-2-11 16]
MIVPGVVSVTFRQLSVPEIVRLTADAGLRAITWGGDVHVPVGDLAAAERARSLTGDAGLIVEGYGSYYKAGESEPAAFADALRTAVALGAPVIRVWAGVTGAADTDPARRAAVTEDLRRCADLAAVHGTRVAVEYHVETLTDDIDSATRLFDEVDALVPYWQPKETPEVDACVKEVRSLLPKLRTVHAFSWGPDGFTERLPLADRADLWRPVLAELNADGQDRFVLLEFVPDDSVEQFRSDAAALLGWSASGI